MYFFPHLYQGQRYSDTLKDNDFDKFLATFQDISPNYSPEFDEFEEKLMINFGSETSVNFTSGFNLHFFYLKK